jgi:hypothetical protein
LQYFRISIRHASAYAYEPKSLKRAKTFINMHKTKSNALKFAYIGVFMHLVLLLNTVNAQQKSGTLTTTNPFTKINNRIAEKAILTQTSEFLLLKPDVLFIKSIYEKRPDSLHFELDLPAGGVLKFHLGVKNILATGFKVETDLQRQVPYSPGAYYQGTYEGKEKTIAAFSFFENEMMAVFSTDDGNYVLGKYQTKDAKSTEAQLYVLYRDDKVLEKPKFKCDADHTANLHDDDINEGQPQYQIESTTPTGACRIVNIYFEADFRMYTDFGSNTTNVVNHTTGLFNVVQQLYNNETIPIQISEIFVWTTQDPYPATNALNILNAFRDRVGTTFNGNLAHLISTRPLGLGGIAYTPGLCTGNSRAGFSNIHMTYQPLPNYSFSTMVIAHELGHNFNSRHTQWCGWQLTPTVKGMIDTCASAEPEVTGGTVCYSGPLKPRMGTIMSYCHLNASINLMLGFGPLPGNAMRARYGSVTCISGGIVSHFTISGTRQVCNGGTISLSATPISGATYLWTGPNGYSGTGQSININNAGANRSGTYALRVVQNSCTSATKNFDVTVRTLNTLPLEESFTATTFPPTGWAVINPDNDVTWVRGTPGGFGGAAGSAMINCFNAPNTTGRLDSLITPAYDISSGAPSELKFDVAYARNTNGGNDTLIVFASTDCGNTFTRIYKKGGTQLSTASNRTTAFTSPLASEWRTETIALNSFSTATRIQFFFVCKSGYGNYLYVDNINVASGVAAPALNITSAAHSNLCPGSGFVVNFTASGTFNSGNQFRVQLSNASGSFSAPTIIGTGTPPSINCEIPADISAGSGYRIRVVATSPFTASTHQDIGINVVIVSPGANINTCLLSAAINLGGSPAGGVWTGPGVSANSFNPSLAGVGTHTLTYQVVQNGCAGSATRIATVTANPIVNAGPDQTVCSGTAPFSLTGTPAGGTWSGPGVTAAGLFTVGSLTGPQLLTYSVTQNGCTGSDNLVITIQSAGTVSAGANQTFCANAAPVNLTGSPAGGTWSGTGVNSSGTFSPSSVSPGTVTLTYTVNSNGCTGSSTVNMTVIALPTVNAGPARTFCNTDGNFTITGNSPSGGTWSGNGVTPSGVFQPWNSTALGSNTLTYTVTQNGCSNSAQVVYTVNQAPNVDAGEDRTVCASAGSVTLTGSPAGGTWSGTGVNASGVFNPSGLSGNYTLTYTVTSGGCTASDQVVINVSNAAASVSAGSNQTFCANASAVNLTGNPAGGTWSGNGVTASGIFTPSAANIGNNVLTYSIASGACSGSAQVTITVNPVPIVNAGPNRTFCSADGNFNITGASPAGGTWSGNGVNAAGVFNPADPSVQATNVLTYTVTQNGCTASATATYTVNQTPTVSAGPNRTVCGGSNPTQINGTPAGGVWSGTGVSPSGVFNPDGLSGNYTLTYTVTQNGCSATATMQVTVNNAALNVQAGTDFTICSNAAPLQLNGTPTGGTWTGLGVTASGLFTPGGLPVGNNVLTYTYTSGTCSNSATVTATVNAAPNVNAGQNRSFCENANNFNITGATPAGGTWTGPGVTAAGLFRPSIAGVGTHTLTYTVTQNGCTSFATTIYTVNPLPVVNAGADRTVCSGGGNVTLTGLPAGGIWSGTGVSAAGVFNPSGLNGNYTLTYSVNQNGCTGTDQMVVTVSNVGANVSAGNDITICSNAAPINLSGNPAGGVWSGNGVSSNGIFSPNSSLVGTQTLTYTISSGSCSGSASTTVTVIAAPVINAGSNRTFCANSANHTITGFSPAGGTWSGTGVFGTVFSPSEAGVGTHSLTYTVTQNGCTNTAQITYTVNAVPAPTVAAPTFLCSGSGNANLSGSPAGGSWTGTGVNSSGVFNPTGLNGSYPITYSVTQNGCTGATTVNITVSNAAANVSAGNNQTICANASPVTLQGSPSGGTWSGAGVSANGIFTPSSSLVGNNTLTYTYTAGGCTGTATLIMTVRAVPNVNAGPDRQFCKNEANFTITGATPANGTWSGQGVSSNGVFSPSTLAPGNYILTYTATQNGCSASDEAVYQVKAVPNANAGPNRTVCASAGNVNLTGTPSGGTWSGNGVSPSGVFNPNGITGNVTLTYTVTQNGCTASSTTVITVYASANVTAGPNTTVCSNDAPFALAGNPAGGTWSGTGVSPSGIFTPNQNNIGTNNLTYTISSGACSGTANMSVTVNAAPTVNAPSSVTVCSNGSDTLIPATPAGGTWSGLGISTNGLFSPIGITGSVTLAYTVTQNGCQAVASTTVNIISMPNDLPISASDSSVCEGNTVSIVVNAPQGLAIQWLRNNVLIPNNTSSILIANQSGLYKSRALAGSCFIESEPILITINPIPEAPEITFDGTRFIGPPAQAYQWYLNGIPLGDSTNQTIVPSLPGEYSLSIGNGNCFSELSTPEMFTPVSVKEMVISKREPRFSLYPNPNQGVFKVLAEYVLLGRYEIQIWDAMGRLVTHRLQQAVDADANEWHFDIHNLPAGHYFLMVKDERKVMGKLRMTVKQ